MLVALLTAPDARPIKTLSFPSAGITDQGILALASLVICCDSISSLNISRNVIESGYTKRMFAIALLVRCRVSIHSTPPVTVLLALV